MKTDKPEWMKTKELHDAEITIGGGNGRESIQYPRSRGATYGPSESLVDQVGDGLIDVNDIMKRFEKMPTMEQLQAAGITSGGFYGDFTTAPDYEEALQIANAARAQFALLPAHVRGRFQNNPSEFLDFVTNEANSDECIRMGLKKPKEAEKEPEVTLKDVRDELRNARKPQNPTTKRREDEQP